MTERAQRGAGGYDLHTHSSISDGTTRPSEIAAGIAELGLEGFALTDHDTIIGWDEARDAAKDLGLDFVPGIEITTKYDDRSRHLLGFGIDPNAGELFQALDAVREARDSRARRMVERLATRYAITWEAVIGDADTVSVGRPHIADALVAAGYFVDRSTAFADVLHPRSEFYVPTYALDTVEAIRLVHEAGGVAVAAHPAAMRQMTPVSNETVRELAAHGLWGIELDHPENRKDWLPTLREVAQEIGLEITGASDYHGAGKPNRLGEHTTPAEVVARLRAVVATPN